MSKLHEHDTQGSRQLRCVPDRTVAPSPNTSANTGRLAGCSGDEGGDNVGGVPIEGPPRAVVSHRRSRIGMWCSFLDISEWHASVESCGDEDRYIGILHQLQALTSSGSPLAVARTEVNLL